MRSPLLPSELGSESRLGEAARKYPASAALEMGWELLRIHRADEEELQSVFSAYLRDDHYSARTLYCSGKQSTARGILTRLEWEGNEEELGPLDWVLSV